MLDLSGDQIVKGLTSIGIVLAELIAAVRLMPKNMPLMAMVLIRPSVLKVGYDQPCYDFGSMSGKKH